MIRIKTQYQYACTCGCNAVVSTYSKRKADRDSNGDITVLSVVLEGDRVLADCYTPEAAQRIASALQFTSPD